MKGVTWQGIEQLLTEIEQAQTGKLLECGRRFIPSLTTEDVLQPNDYPLLEAHPLFRYEEGILSGIHTVRMALLAYKNEHPAES